MAKNQVCHIEWNVTDLDRARHFYEGVFGWSFAASGTEMIVFGIGNDHIGGLTRVESVSAGISPSVWFEADDLDVYFAKAEQFGGSTDGLKDPVPGVGFAGVLNDPDGNRVGLVQFDRR